MDQPTGGPLPLGERPVLSIILAREEAPMKKILMIGTGGTIASEMTEAGLAPGLTGEAFLDYVPGVRKL